MLLGLEARGAGGAAAEVEETADFVAEAGKRFVVYFAAAFALHGAYYIALRYKWPSAWHGKIKAHKKKRRAFA
ncbi:MAG TPA: hypothetical protein VMB02_04020 [Candidatus Aquilonibacter sp.]|nr:hypothetical protein [Candidatus Aquilonibacter sp.]